LSKRVSAKLLPVMESLQAIFHQAQGFMFRASEEGIEAGFTGIRVRSRIDKKHVKW
jgi:hypothetical protein